MSTPLTVLRRVDVPTIGTCVLSRMPDPDGGAGKIHLHVPTPFPEIPALVLTTGLTGPKGARPDTEADFFALCAAIDDFWVERVATAAVQSAQTALDKTPEDARALLRAKATVDNMLRIAGIPA